MTVVRNVQVSGQVVNETIHLAGGTDEDGSLTDDYWVGVLQAGEGGALASIRWEKRTSAKWGVRVGATMRAVPIEVPRLQSSLVEALMAEPEASRTVSAEPKVVLGAEELARIPASFDTRLRDNLAKDKAKLPATLAEAWSAILPQAIVLVGGRQQEASQEVAPEDGLTVWRSTNSGASWEKELKLTVAEAPERVGGAMVMIPNDDGTSGTLVLTGGMMLGLVPLADVLVSSDAGQTWAATHPQGGSATDADVKKRNTLRRRAFHCLERAGKDLVAMGGDASGTPAEELDALGITASGMTTVVEDAQVAASAIGDAATQEADSTQKMMTIVLVGLGLALLALLLLMQFWFYRRYYRDIPKAYIRTEKAWREALEKVSRNPAAYDIGQSASLQKSLSEIGSLASIGQQSLVGPQNLFGF
jgi:hypothetical protein